MSAHLHLQGDEAADEQEEEDETAALFRLAAEQLKEKREEDAMSVEERILKCVSLMSPSVVTQQQDFLFSHGSRLACVRRWLGRHYGHPKSTEQYWQKGCQFARTDKRWLHKYVAWCAQVHDKVV